MRIYLYTLIAVLACFAAAAQQPFAKQPQPQTSEVSFYPNPAKDMITFRYQSGKTLEIVVYNVLGSKVKTFVHTGSETNINISDLQKGIYFIRFTDGNAVITRSFTKSE